MARAQLGAGRVGLRPWQRDAAVRNLWIESDGRRQAIELVPAEAGSEVSIDWQAYQDGTAQARYSLDTLQADRRGVRAQRIQFLSGQGRVGIRHSIAAASTGPATREYFGFLDVTSADTTSLFVTAQRARVDRGRSVY